MSGTDWAQDFYSTTGTWWGKAEAKVTNSDHRRAATLSRLAGRGAERVLELGSGYGATAVATARAGYEVTAVELTDRIDHARRLVEDTDTVTFHQADFYQVELDGRFDVVTYWNGFGVGDDGDQRRLLRRIASEWLAPGGVALIDVQNPFVWAAWDGDEEHRLPRPERGYEHELRERTSFDPVTCRATDSWWDVTRPDRVVTQVLRCYTPADLRLLVEGTGLRLTGLVLGDADIALDRPQAVAQALLGDERHEYLAVLVAE